VSRQEFVLRVFAAFPSDLAEEVAVLASVIDELNSTVARETGKRLELLTWKTHATPGVSTDPQAVINECVDGRYDVFVGLLWKRFGSRTPRAESGTAEEFDVAYQRAKSRPESVRVMFYFKRAPVSFEEIDPAQIGAVNAFRERLGPKGVLYWDFGVKEEFEKYLRIHLARQLIDFGRTWGGPVIPSNSNVRPERLPGHDAPDEGILDLMEQASESLQIATESAERIGRIQTQMGTRIGEKTLQLQAVSGTAFSQEEKSRLARQIFNAAAVDLEQFAKGFSNETAVISEHFMGGVDAVSKALTYTECYRSNDVAAVVTARETYSQLGPNVEFVRNAVIGLREEIRTLPRFTTSLNRAKRIAVAAIDDFERFSNSAISLLAELERSFDSLLSSFDRLPPQKTRDPSF
jgi:hypothetical protein